MTFFCSGCFLYNYIIRRRQKGKANPKSDLADLIVC